MPKPQRQVALWLVILAAAFPVRFGIGGGRTASLFDVACLVVVPLALAGSLISRHRPEMPRSIVRATVLSAFVSLASIGWSFGKTRTILHSISWVEAGLLVAFCATRVPMLRPEQVMKWVARFAWLLIAGAVALEAHVPGFKPPTSVDLLSGDFASYYSRLSHPFIGRSNNLATLLAVFFLPLAWWAVRYRRHRLIAALTGVAIVATLSRGVVLGLVIAAVLAAPGARKTARRLIPWLLSLAILSGFAVAVAALAIPSVGSRLGSRLSLSNVLSRADLLHLGSRQIAAHPVLGVGGGIGDNIHDTFVQQLVYYGIGLGTLVALVILLVPRWFFRQAAPVARICGWSLVGVWLSCLVESSLEGTLLLPEVFLGVGLLVALVQAAELHGEPPSGYARPPRAKKPSRRPPPPVPRRPKEPTARVPVDALTEDWQRALGLTT